MKKFIMLLAITLCILCISGCSVTISYKNPKVEKFSILDYQWEIETFPSDKNVGEVTDAKAAVEKAKILWAEDPVLKDCINERRLLVAYDKTNDCWCVEGTLPRRTDGAVPCAIMRGNGEVLTVCLR